jgi:hypothetical protein
VQPAKLEVLRGELTDEDPRWTVVTNVPNAILGNLIKSQLEDAGIPVVMMRSKSADIAYFSHNDYVPHDIRVPFSKLREARSLIDSPVGGNFVERNWEEFNAGAEVTVGEGEEQWAGLPEGWSVLPTEADMRTRQMVRRSMGKPPDDWYWSDDRRKAAAEEEQEEVQGGSHWQELYDRSAAGPGFRRKDDFAFEEYAEYAPYRNSDPYAPSKWVRWFYAILMLALSLPFILQLLRTLFSFGQPLP